MMKKLSLAVASLSLVVSQAAFATEVNPDPGFDNNLTWMATGTHFSVSGSKAVGTGATAMEMLMAMNVPSIKKGHRYTYSFDVTNYTSGKVRPFVGLTHSSPPTFVPDLTVDENGASPIADNFDYNSGLDTGQGIPAQDGMGVDPVGAFRMICGPAHLAPDDPEVLNNLPGASHLHQFIGNTGTNAKSTWTSLRKYGGTTCGSTNSQRFPINRSAYWYPAMLDGNGHAVQPSVINLYYKREPNTDANCNRAAHPTTAVAYSCGQTPRGIRYLWGYNFANDTLGPKDMDVNMFWDCIGQDDNPIGTGRKQHLNQWFGGVCPIGAYIEMSTTAPNCWDMTNLDTANHRDHVVYQSAGLSGDVNHCNSGWRLIPFLNFQIYWQVDANFVAGKWHLSSDEMVAAAATDPGRTFHMDYIEAWAPEAMTTLTAHCIDRHASCSGGALGDGTAIKSGNTTAQGVSGINLVQAFGWKGRYVSVSNFGMGGDASANGHFSGEFTAWADGTLGLMGVADTSGNGFVGSVDNLSIQEITTGLSGPATVHP